MPYLEAAYDKNWHTNSGPASLQFEQQLANFFAFEAEAVTAVSNATSGLSACLIAHRISGPVICPAFTFQATACAILGAGAHPVVVDVDAVSGVVSANMLERCLTETGAKAAMVVAPYGIETDFSEHADVCLRRGSRLIIDNAAGLAPGRTERSMGALADHIDEVFSLHATKVFGVGEGGGSFLCAASSTCTTVCDKFWAEHTHGNRGRTPAFLGH